MSLAGRLQDLLHDVLVSSPGGYGPDTPGVLADVDPALRSKILDELEDVLYGFIDGEVEWARNRDSGPLSDDEQAEIRAARKAGYTESAALDLIVKLRETKDRDATISEQAAEIERLERLRDSLLESCSKYEAMKVGWRAALDLSEGTEEEK